MSPLPALTSLLSFRPPWHLAEVGTGHRHADIALIRLTSGRSTVLFPSTSLASTFLLTAVSGNTAKVLLVTFFKVTVILNLSNVSQIHGHGVSGESDTVDLAGASYEGAVPLTTLHIRHSAAPGAR